MSFCLTTFRKKKLYTTVTVLLKCFIQYLRWIASRESGKPLKAKSINWCYCQNSNKRTNNGSYMKTNLIICKPHHSIVSTWKCSRVKCYKISNFQFLKSCKGRSFEVNVINFSYHVQHFYEFFYKKISLESLSYIKEIILSVHFNCHSSSLLDLVKIKILLYISLYKNSEIDSSSLGLSNHINPGWNSLWYC